MTNLQTSNVNSSPTNVDVASLFTNPSAPEPQNGAKSAIQADPKKNRDYFRKEMQKATFVFYRSAKAVADLLLEARLTLSPEEFENFINEDCQFDSSLVYKFLKMAADYRLNDPANELYLPEAWTARYEIMLMKEATFRIGVKAGIIHPGCKLDDLKKLREQIEGSKAKGKNMEDKKNAATKQSGEGTVKTAPVVAVVPAQASTLTVTTGPELAEEASVKAPVNTSVLKVVERATKPTKSAGKGRIAILLSREVADQNKEQVAELRERLQRLVKKFAFVEAVDVEVAA